MRNNMLLRAGLLVMAVLLLFTGGCASPKNVFVLLPSPDGHTGELAVTNQTGEKLLRNAFQATGADSQKEPLLEPFTMKEEDVAKLFGGALAAQPAQPVIFLLYFESNKAALTDESEKLLPKIIAQISGSASKYVSIVGHADRTGTQELNVKLSLERAYFVYNKLVEMGVDPMILEIASHGMDNPLVDTPYGVPEPRNRRVEVTVR